MIRRPPRFTLFPYTAPSSSKRRGCLAKGGVVDYDRASRIFINDLRAGALGPITFETPEMVLQEITELQATKDAKIARKQARKETRRRERQ